MQTNKHVLLALVLLASCQGAFASALLQEKVKDAAVGLYKKLALKKTALAVAAVGAGVLLYKYYTKETKNPSIPSSSSSSALSSFSSPASAPLSRTLGSNNNNNNNSTANSTLDSNNNPGALSLTPLTSTGLSSETDSTTSQLGSEPDVLHATDTNETF